MTASRLRWAFLAVIYAAFLVWYGGSGDPISPEEVEKYVAIVEARNSGTDDARARVAGFSARLREFMETDDGQEFPGTGEYAPFRAGEGTLRLENDQIRASRPTRYLRTLYCVNQFASS